jgi:hypothetical protein
VRIIPGDPISLTFSSSRSAEDVASQLAVGGAPPGYSQADVPLGQSVTIVADASGRQVSLRVRPDSLAVRGVAWRTQFAGRIEARGTGSVVNGRAGILDSRRLRLIHASFAIGIAILAVLAIAQRDVVPVLYIAFFGSVLRLVDYQIDRKVRQETELLTSFVRLRLT